MKLTNKAENLTADATDRLLQIMQESIKEDVDAQIMSMMGMSATDATNHPRFNHGLSQRTRRTAYDTIGKLAVLGQDEAVQLLTEMLETIDRNERTIRNMRDQLERSRLERIAPSPKYTLGYDHTLGYDTSYDDSSTAYLNTPSLRDVYQIDPLTPQKK